MQTTLDLPDELLHQVEQRANQDGVTPKDLVAHYIAQGLAASASVRTDGRYLKRSPLPVIRKAATGQPIPALSNAEIQAILDEEDAEHVNRSIGY